MLTQGTAVSAGGIPEILLQAAEHGEELKLLEHPQRRKAAPQQ